MRKWIRGILLISLLAAFLFSTGKVLTVRNRYKRSEQFYESAAETYTQTSSFVRESQYTEAESTKQPTEETQESVPLHMNTYAPIEVDFDALLSVSDNVIGWIYCEDTVINYPVVHADNNDYYLHRNYAGGYDPCGSIFSDASNSKGFQDANVILYGHHMQNMSMFATLKYWLNQEYYEEHPVMWLLTPEQDYQIVLFSGYVTSALSVDTYSVFYSHGVQLEKYLKGAQERSAFDTDVELDINASYVVLSTCAYSFENARTVLHGMLVPVDSAGGVPISEIG